MQIHPDIQPPTPATLKRYGLSSDEWSDILARQGGVCGVCAKVPNPNAKTGKVRFVIDHEHVRGWKKMLPEERKLYVRGLTCWYCNSAYLARGINIDKARGVLAYLVAYEMRRPPR